MEQPGPPRASGWFTPFLMVACAALAIVVLLLVRSGSALRAQNASLEAELSKAQDQVHNLLTRNALAAGEPLAMLTLIDADGVKSERRFDGGERSTLMLVASHACDACAANIDAWATAVRERPASCDAMVVYIDGPPEQGGAAGTHDAIGAPGYGAPGARASALGRISLLPATIVVGPDGIVQHIWYGVLTEETTHDVVMALTAE